jgi:hypothetical protein
MGCPDTRPTSTRLQNPPISVTALPVAPRRAAATCSPPVVDGGHRCHTANHAAASTHPIDALQRRCACRAAARLPPRLDRLRRACDRNMYARIGASLQRKRSHCGGRHPVRVRWGVRAACSSSRSRRTLASPAEGRSGCRLRVISIARPSPQPTRIGRAASATVESAAFDECECGLARLSVRWRSCCCVCRDDCWVDLAQAQVTADDVADVAASARAASRAAVAGGSGGSP